MEFLSNLTLSDAIDVATNVVTIASIFVAVTPTPASITLIGKAYKIIEALALVTGKAKQKGE